MSLTRNKHPGEIFLPMAPRLFFLQRVTERGRETRQGNSAIAGSLLRKDPLSPRETLLPHSVSEQPGATDEGSYHSLLPLRDTHGLPEESLSVPSGSTSWDQWKPQGH